MKSLHCVQVEMSGPAPELAEAIEWQLWSLEPQGVERQDDETFSDFVDDPRPRQPGVVRWRVYSEGDGKLEEKASAIVTALNAIAPNVTVDAWSVDDLSFLDAWKAFFRPTQVSPRLIVHPPWELPEASWEGARLNIEPGMAFGTGTHETTRLCLRLLDALLDHTSQRVLDVGTGSGILAIAAAKLGAESVLGTDNDPIAVRVAEENAIRNGVDTILSWTTEPLEALDSTWPLVVANILPVTLLEIRKGLIDRLSPGGDLVLSGILNTEADRFIEDFCEDFEVVTCLEDGLWTALHVRRVI